MFAFKFCLFHLALMLLGDCKNLNVNENELALES